MMTLSLFRLARIAVSSGNDERGVFFSAAASAVAETIGVLPNPRLTPTLDDARARMGDEAFTLVWEVGSALTLDEAVADALELVSEMASG